MQLSSADSLPRTSGDRGRRRCEFSSTVEEPAAARSVHSRARFLSKEITDQGLTILRGKLLAAFGKLLTAAIRREGNARLQKFLIKHRNEIFGTLHVPKRSRRRTLSLSPNFVLTWSPANSPAPTAATPVDKLSRSCRPLLALAKNSISPPSTGPHNSSAIQLPRPSSFEKR